MNRGESQKIAWSDTWKKLIKFVVAAILIINTPAAMLGLSHGKLSTGLLVGAIVSFSVLIFSLFIFLDPLIYQELYKRYEKDAVARFETKYFNRPAAILIFPYIILFHISTYIIFGTWLVRGSLSDYQKAVEDNIFLPIFFMIMAAFFGSCLYYVLVVKFMKFWRYLLAVILGGITLFFLGITAIFQYQAYYDWFSSPVVLSSHIRDLRVSPFEPYNLLFKVEGDDKLWDIPQSGGIVRDNNERPETVQYKELSDPETVIKVYHSPKGKSLIKIVNEKNNALIYPVRK